MVESTQLILNIVLQGNIHIKKSQIRSILATNSYALKALKTLLSYQIPPAIVNTNALIKSYLNRILSNKV